MNHPKSIRRAFVILLMVSLAIRAFLAGFIELGNDEVYYWTYARFPDWSHFDHPPMVGFLIQLFTLNLHFPGEFFLRLGPVLIGTFNTWLIFRAGKMIRDDLTGLYAAFLYTASFYCSVITGTFIMPDGPQGLFWMLSLVLLLEILPDRDLTPRSRRLFLLTGVTIGLAILSKYHSVFLPAGVFLYILLFNRRWFRAKETWLAFLFIVILALPILIWNAQNHFISFTFHESRIGRDERLIRWDYFSRELVGQIIYTNPVNFVLVTLALIALARGRKFLPPEYSRVLLLLSLPLVAVVLFLSLTSSTLPHWTGPAFYGLILLAAAWLSGIYGARNSVPIFPAPLKGALVLILLVVVLAPVQIHFGIIPLKKMGLEDFSVQLYGWRQLGSKFGVLAAKDEASGIIKKGSPIVSYRWFPAANLDYYVATPAGKKMYALGTLERIHKYYWIDKQNGRLEKGSDAYFITLKDDHYCLESGIGQLYGQVLPPDTLAIMRQGEKVNEAYVYRFKNLQRTIRFDSLEWFLAPPIHRIHHWMFLLTRDDTLHRQMVDRAKQLHRPLIEVVWDQAMWNSEQELIP